MAVYVDRETKTHSFKVKSICLQFCLQEQRKKYVEKCMVGRFLLMWQNWGDIIEGSFQNWCCEETRRKQGKVKNHAAFNLWQKWKASSCLCGTLISLACKSVRMCQVFVVWVFRHLVLSVLSPVAFSPLLKVWTVCVHVFYVNRYQHTNLSNTNRHEQWK